MLFMYNNDTLTMSDEQYYFEEKDINRVELKQVPDDYKVEDIPDNWYPIYKCGHYSMQFDHFNSEEKARKELLTNENVSLYERYNDL